MGCCREYLGLRRTSEKRVLQRIFGPKTEEVTEEWRKLHNDELNDLYCSLNFIRVMKSRTMKWAGHVARMRERRGAYSVLSGNLRERDHFEDVGLDGRLILN